MTGKIKSLVGKKKFGFIRGEDGKDYFFHENSLTDYMNFNLLEEGMEVEFIPGKGKKGPRTESVSMR